MIAPTAGAACRPPQRHGAQRVSGGHVNAKLETLAASMGSAYLARQPIVDRSRKLIGFELLYRDSKRNAAPEQVSSLETVMVLVNALGVIGLAEVSGHQRLYLNFDAAGLSGDASLLLPPGQVVLEILETSTPDDALLEQCRTLRRQGYSLALDDFVHDPRWDRFLGVVDTIKLDMRQLDAGQMREHVELARAHGLKVIAEKVERHDEFEAALALGCDAFQGFFFAYPEILVERPLPTSVGATLDLMRRLQAGEGTRSIEQALSRDTALLYRLLRYAGGVAFGSRAPQSLREALLRLGERNLMRWLTLELYASARTDHAAADALLDLASVRAETMAELARCAGHPADTADEAGAVGGLSLLEALLCRPMRQLVEGVALPERMRMALLERTGVLGDLLRLAEALEHGDPREVARVCAEAGVDGARVPEAQLRALKAHAQSTAARRS